MEVVAWSTTANALEQGAVAADTSIDFLRHTWEGTSCLFAYTDPVFRIEPCHGCMEIEAAKLWSFVGEHDGVGCLVINPGGPATCTLEPAELQALAR